MQVVNRATLKHAERPTVSLALFRVEANVFRWIKEPEGVPWNGVDYLTKPDAIKHLRVSIDSDPEHVGVDMTIIPVEPPPEVRAAERIAVQALLHNKLDVDGVADIIRQETQTDKLLEHAQLLLVYYMKTARFPKKAGLDVTMAGLAYNLMEAIEKATKQDLGKLKASLQEAPAGGIQVFASLPPGAKGGPIN